MNLFYGAFEKGVLTDGEGRAIDFKNTVIVMTSNLGDEILASAAAEVPAPSYDRLVSRVKPALRDFFRPALLGRMTVVPYVPIRSDALGDIVRTKLRAVAERSVESQGVALSFADDVVAAVAARCSEVDTGARNVDHIVRGSILPLVSDAILGAVARGDATGALRVVLNGNGGFQLEGRT